MSVIQGDSIPRGLPVVVVLGRILGDPAEAFAHPTDRQVGVRDPDEPCPGFAIVETFDRPFARERRAQPARRLRASFAQIRVDGGIEDRLDRLDTGGVVEAGERGDEAALNTDTVGPPPRHHFYGRARTHCDSSVTT